MGARTALAGRLEAQLAPRYRVVPDPREVTSLEGGLTGVLQLVRTATKPAPQAPKGALQSDFDLFLIVPFSNPVAGEDALDDALDELVGVLERDDSLVWESATRYTYGEGFLAYRIPLHTLYTMTEGE